MRTTVGGREVTVDGLGETALKEKLKGDDDWEELLEKEGVRE